MRYVMKLLSRNEKIVRVTRSHWVTLLPTILTDLAASVLIIGVSVAGILIAPPFTWFGLLLLLVPIVHFLVVWVIWRNRELVVTNRRVIQVSGVVNKNVSDSLLEKINDIITTQSAIGRLLGYGDVQIISGSELGIDEFRRIKDPIGFKKVLLEEKQTETATGYGAAQAADSDEVLEMVRELGELREKGVLTEEEFAQKKRELLDRI